MGIWRAPYARFSHMLSMGAADVIIFQRVLFFQFTDLLREWTSVISPFSVLFLVLKTSITPAMTCGPFPIHVFFSPTFLASFNNGFDITRSVFFYKQNKNMNPTCMKKKLSSFGDQNCSGFDNFGLFRLCLLYGVNEHFLLKEPCTVEKQRNDEIFWSNLAIRFVLLLSFEL